MKTKGDPTVVASLNCLVLVLSDAYHCHIDNQWTSLLFLVERCARCMHDVIKNKTKQNQTKNQKTGFFLGYKKWETNLF